MSSHVNYIMIVNSNITVMDVFIIFVQVSCYNIVIYLHKTFRCFNKIVNDDTFRCRNLGLWGCVHSQIWERVAICSVIVFGAGLDM